MQNSIIIKMKLTLKLLIEVIGLEESRAVREGW